MSATARTTINILAGGWLVVVDVQLEKGQPRLGLHPPALVQHGQLVLFSGSLGKAVAASVTVNTYSRIINPDVTCDK